MLPERIWWCKLTGMPPAKVGKLAPVTLGHMRSQGCRDLLVYCNSDHCDHRTIMNVGHLPDDTPIKSLGDRIVCTRCGHRCGRGAELADPCRAGFAVVRLITSSRRPRDWSGSSAVARRAQVANAVNSRRLISRPGLPRCARSGANDHPRAAAS
jgi:hypothetical protein